MLAKDNLGLYLENEKTRRLSVKTQDQLDQTLTTTNLRDFPSSTFMVYIVFWPNSGQEPPNHLL